jgi:hypothetical protein
MKSRCRKCELSEKKRLYIGTYFITSKTTFRMPWITNLYYDMTVIPFPALAHPEFGSSVNPIPTRRADYFHRINGYPPRFENVTASL